MVCGRDIEGGAQKLREKWEARCVLMSWLAGAREAAEGDGRVVWPAMERYAHLAAEPPEPAYP